jgi:hypothetical protein
VRISSLVAAAGYDVEWQEFQERQGFRNGPIPEAFKVTVDLVKAHNAANTDYQLTYTGPFAAMTAEEFRLRQGMRPVDKNNYELPMQATHVVSGEVLPDSVDWTTKGVVTPIKNQGACGSCWSFSVTGTTEGQWAIATGKLPSLSEQFFVDCAGEAHNMGCSGGYMDKTLDWAVSQWLPTEESYPYKASRSECVSGGWDVAISKGQVTGHNNVTDETSLKDAVANVGPISIAIEADQAAFQHYASGVITDGCGTNLDHGVLAVGYGTMDGKDYWKVKNSWGDSWGENGYVFLQRGVGMCGVGTQSNYPTVDPQAPPTPSPPSPPPAPPAAPCDFGDGSFTQTCAETCLAWCHKTTGGLGECFETADKSHFECNCQNGKFCTKDQTPSSVLV